MLSDIFFINNFIRDHYNFYVDDTAFKRGSNCTTCNFSSYIKTACDIWKHVTTERMKKVTVHMTSDKSIAEGIPTYRIQPYKVSLLNIILSGISEHVRLTELHEPCKFDILYNKLAITDTKTMITVKFDYASSLLNLSVDIINMLAIHMNHVCKSKSFCDLDKNMFSIIIYMKLQDMLHDINVIKDASIFMLSLIESIKILD